MDYIKYTIDGQTTYLENRNGQWVETLNAPDVAGSYDFDLEVSKNGAITYLNSYDPRVNLQLQVQQEVPQVVNLISYLPEFMQEVKEFQTILNAENVIFNTLSRDVGYVLNQLFMNTASPDTILKWENFLGIKGEGSLEQRKSYIMAMIKKGDKLSEKSIKTIVNTLTGSDAIVTFYAENDVTTPQVGHAVLLVQVLSPDNSKDYKYDDIQRMLEPLVPGHIKLIVVKYFATWGDIKENYASWEAVALGQDWQAINDYIPPM